MRYCLEEARLAPGDLNYIVFYEKPLRKFERLLETYLAYAPAGFRSFRMALPVWLKEKTHLAKQIREGVGVSDTPLVFTDHHESHAASAFFPSPFESAAILTLDGVGEWSTTTCGIGSGNRIKLTRHLEFPPRPVCSDRQECLPRPAEPAFPMGELNLVSHRRRAPADDAPVVGRARSGATSRIR